MALSRCLDHHSPPQGRTTTYSNYVLPVGYPVTALICGNPQCEEPGAVWLTTDEAAEYTNGGRIFEGPNRFAKMKADNGGLRTLTR